MSAETVYPVRGFPECRLHQATSMEIIEIPLAMMATDANAWTALNHAKNKEIGLEYTICQYTRFSSNRAVILDQEKQFSCPHIYLVYTNEF